MTFDNRNRTKLGERELFVAVTIILTIGHLLIEAAFVGQCIICLDQTFQPIVVHAD